MAKRFNCKSRYTKHYGYEVITNATEAVEIITLYKKVP